jgi:hypothetical protein
MFDDQARQVISIEMHEVPNKMATVEDITVSERETRPHKVNATTWVINVYAEPGMRSMNKEFVRHSQARTCDYNMG